MKWHKRNHYAKQRLSLAKQRAVSIKEKSHEKTSQAQNSFSANSLHPHQKAAHHNRLRG
jgi:hypothetical protein